MRKMKVYPAHPCIVCAETTTNKSMCDKHLKFVTKPVFTPIAGLSIIADMESAGRKMVQRHENVGVMR